MGTPEENRRYRYKMEHCPETIKRLDRKEYWIRRRFDNLVQQGIIVPEVDEEK